MATENRSSTWHNARLFAVNSVLLLAGIFNLGWGCYQAVEGQLQLAITCLTAGLLLLLASTIDRFELLKGFGIEAKTRALEKVLSEAGVTLDQLQQLAEITSRSIVSLTSGAGRVGSAPTIRKSAETIDEVRHTLQKLGTDPAKIREIVQPWVRITLFDAAMHIVKDIRAEVLAVQQNANNDAQAFKEPRSPANEVRFTELTARAQAASEFNRDQVGNPGVWSLESISARLSQIVAEMPVLHEDNRVKLRNEVELWSPRFAHMIANQELLDREAWFEIR